MNPFQYLFFTLHLSMARLVITLPDVRSHTAEMKNWVEEKMRNLNMTRETAEKILKIEESEEVFSHLVLISWFSTFSRKPKEVSGHRWIPEVITSLFVVLQETLEEFRGYAIKYHENSESVCPETWEKMNNQARGLLSMRETFQRSSLTLLFLGFEDEALHKEALKFLRKLEEVDEEVLPVYFILRGGVNFEEDSPLLNPWMEECLKEGPPLTEDPEVISAVDEIVKDFHPTVNQIRLYAKGEMTVDATAAVWDHLKKCPDCKAVADGIDVPPIL